MTSTRVVVAGGGITGLAAAFTLREEAARRGLAIELTVLDGAIQVPGAGEPILLMADRQTAGGYPKIGHVISADLPIAGQLAPGDFIEFILCSRQEAVAALIARERQLLRFADLKDAS